MKEKINGEIKPTFEGLYFTIALGNLVQIWYVGCTESRDRICSIKMIPIQEGNMELCMHENRVLFLLVNIL